MNIQAETNLNDLKLIEHQLNELLNNLAAQGANRHTLTQTASHLRDCIGTLKLTILDSGRARPL